MVMISDDFGALMWRGLLVVWDVIFLTFAISSAAHRNYLYSLPAGLGILLFNIVSISTVH